MDKARHKTNSPTGISDTQRAAIRRAVLAGRAEVRMDRSDPNRFFRAFAKNGGIHAPGREMRESERAAVRSAGTEALAFGKRLSDYRNVLAADLIDVARRETNRANSEAYWAGAAGSPDVAGMRLILSPNQTPDEEVTRLVTEDRHGMGPGVFPPDEVVVLPPSCDLASWEVVFSDELP